MATGGREITGECTTCWGEGEIGKGKNKKTCPDCNGKGERTIVLVGETNK